MGRLIQFPVHRLRRNRVAAAHVFGAFNELETIERAQVKLFGACIGGALLVMLAVQLALG